jgi:hypothetical protein
VADDSCPSKYQCFNDSQDALAFTYTTASKRSGKIYDADIIINATKPVFFTTVDGPGCGSSPPSYNCVVYDLQNVLTHEIGHFIGLDHVEDPTSTMYPSAIPGELDKRSIDPDSAAGLCDTYPRGLPPTPCVGTLDQHIIGTNVGTATPGCTSSASGGGLGSVWACLAAMFLRARLRARRR